MKQYSLLQKKALLTRTNNLGRKMDKTCSYFGIAPPSFMSMGYCKIKSENFRFVACNADNWKLCEIILKKQRKGLEKEVNEFGEF
jgi:hypothetical protein